MLIYKNITTASIVILFALSVINLVSSNILSTKGIQIASQEKEILRLEKENHYLKNQIEETNSLSDLENYSKTMGFVQSGQVVYMQNLSGFALK